MPNVSEIRDPGRVDVPDAQGEAHEDVGTVQYAGVCWLEEPPLVEVGSWSCAWAALQRKACAWVANQELGRAPENQGQKAKVRVQSVGIAVPWAGQSGLRLMGSAADVKRTS
ncbi:hypothetical protein GGTG_09425 [Gaeumannomyces tritici R3-111a-1]|uniref:Uncharacterized protein n=1 Tax=Gaeumannomyces tritici (strain R3-111a-1) TaxID=644352 RepID=J3P7D2_GAET3|nr:hypothetical protein GGTG_09425 [Gaeumannomyces tritici R3-111a-1]EJT72563.1 hypothetical protein GGTG_09425 [Gaeumannomyces tritici R3-111a-1]